MAQGTLDIGVVLNGFGVANEQLGAIQSRVEGLRDTLTRIKAVNLVPEAERSAEQVATLASGVEALGQAMTDVALTSATQLANALLQLTRANREAGIQFEQMSIALTRFAEEGQTVKHVMADIVKLSKLPMVDLQTAMRSFVALRSTRMEAEDAKNVITEFSTALASVGASSEDLNGVTRALTQIMAKGKVYAEEIYQIAERLPQTRAVMQDAFGTANTEELAKEGITSYEFIKQITAGLKEINVDSAGLMDTTANAITNLNNQLFLLKANMAGTMEVFKGATNILTSVLEHLNENHEGLLAVTGTALTVGQAILQMGTSIIGTGLVIGVLTDALTGAGVKGAILKGVSETIRASFTMLGKPLMALVSGLKGLFIAITATTAGTVALIAGVVALAGALGYLWYKKHQDKKATESITKSYEDLNKIKKEAKEADNSLAKSDMLMQRFDLEMEKIKELRKEYQDGKEDKSDFFETEQGKEGLSNLDQVIEQTKKNFEELGNEMNIGGDVYSGFNKLIAEALEATDAESKRSLLKDAQKYAKENIAEISKSKTTSVATRAKEIEDRVRANRADQFGRWSKNTVRIEAGNLWKQQDKSGLSDEAKETKKSANELLMRFYANELTKQKVGTTSLIQQGITTITEPIADDVEGILAVTLNSVDDIEKAKTILKQVTSKAKGTEGLKIGSKDIEEASKLLGSVFLTPEQLALIENKDYNLEDAVKATKEANDILTKQRAMITGEIASNPNFLVRDLEAERSLLETRLSLLPDKGSLSPQNLKTLINDDKFKELELTENNFWEKYEKNVDLQVAYLDLVKAQDRETQRSRIKLQAKISESEAITALTDQGMREVIFALQNVVGDHDGVGVDPAMQGYGAVLTWLQENTRGASQAMRDQVESLIGLFGETFEIDKENPLADPKLKNLFALADSPAVEGESEVVKHMRAVLREKLTIQKELTATDLTAVIESLGAGLRASGQNLEQQLHALDKEIEGQDRRVEATRIKMQIEQKISDLKDMGDVLGSYANEKFRDVLSATLEYQIKGLELQANMAEKAKSIETDAEKLEYERAKSAFDAYKEGVDQSYQKVTLAKNKLKADLEFYNSEQERLSKQDELNELRLDRSKSPEEITALQNELNNEIEQNKVQSQINAQDQIIRDQIIQHKKIKDEANSQGYKLSKEFLDFLAQQLQFEEQKMSDLEKRKTALKRIRIIQSGLDNIEIEISQEELKMQQDIIVINREIYSLRNKLSELGQTEMSYQIKDAELRIKLKKAENKLQAEEKKENEHRSQVAIDNAKLELDGVKQEITLNNNTNSERRKLKSLRDASAKREREQEVFKAYGIGTIGQLGKGQNVAKGYFDQLSQRRSLEGEREDLIKQREGTLNKDDRGELTKQIDIINRKLGERKLNEEAVVRIQTLGKDLNEAIVNQEDGKVNWIRFQLSLLENIYGELNVIDVISGDYLQKQQRITDFIKEQNESFAERKSFLEHELDLASLWAESLDPDSLMSGLASKAFEGNSEIFKSIQDQVSQTFGKDFSDDADFMQTMIDLAGKRGVAELELHNASERVRHLESLGIAKTHSDYIEADRIWTEKKLAKEQVYRNEVRTITEAYGQINEQEKQRLNNSVSHMEKIQNSMYRLQKAEFELNNPQATDQQKKKFGLEQERAKILTDAQFQMAKLGEIEKSSMEVGTKDWMKYGQAIEIAMNTLVEYTEWQSKAQQYNMGSRNTWKEMIEKERKYNQARESIETKHVATMLGIRKKYGQEFKDLANSEGETAEQYAEKRNSIEEKQLLEFEKAEKASQNERIKSRDAYRKETAEFNRKHRGAKDPFSMGGDPFEELAKSNPIFKDFLNSFIGEEIEGEKQEISKRRTDNKDKSWFSRLWSGSLGDPKKVDDSDTVLGRMSKSQAFRQILSEKGIMQDIQSGKSIGDAMIDYGNTLTPGTQQADFFESNKQMFLEMAEKAKPVEKKIHDELVSIRQKVVGLNELEKLQKGNADGIVEQKMGAYGHQFTHKSTFKGFRDYEDYKSKNRLIPRIEEATGVRSDAHKEIARLRDLIQSANEFIKSWKGGTAIGGRDWASFDRATDAKEGWQSKLDTLYSENPSVMYGNTPSSSNVETLRDYQTLPTVEGRTPTAFDRSKTRDGGDIYIDLFMGGEKVAENVQGKIREKQDTGEFPTSSPVTGESHTITGAWESAKSAKTDREQRVKANEARSQVVTERQAWQNENRRGAKGNKKVEFQRAGFEK